jgi:hypothetical protein
LFVKRRGLFIVGYGVREQNHLCFFRGYFHVPSPFLDPALAHDSFFLPSARRLLFKEPF